VLQAAKAALAASGYRIARGTDSHHRTLESLAQTIGLDPASVRRLGVFRKRRNTAEYDHAGVTSDVEADEMRALAETVRNQVVAWLGTNYPDLWR
jgi:xanthine dehydrogenase molybdopterin-binding subunit B